MDNEMKMDEKEFLDACEHWLELFDQEFSFLEIPPSNRPLKAAIKLVKEGAIEIKGIDSWQQDYLTSDWFALIVRAIKSWYEGRLGTAAIHPKNSMLSGLILIHGTPTKIEIPVTTAEIEVEGESSWMRFPHELLPSEKIESFFPTKPNLQNSQLLADQDFLQLLSDVIGRSRRINLSLMMRYSDNDDTNNMAAVIWAQMEDGIRKLLSFESPQITASCWDFHLALEMTFKVFIGLHGKVKHVHDLNVLSQDAEQFGLTVSSEILTKLPKDKEAISRRYAQNPARFQDAYQIYLGCLELMDEICLALPKSIDLSQAKLLLKKPKWV